MRTGNEVINARMNLQSASGTAVVQQVPREPLSDPWSVVSSVRINIRLQMTHGSPRDNNNDHIMIIDIHGETAMISKVIPRIGKMSDFILMWSSDHMLSLQKCKRGEKSIDGRW